MKHVLILKAGQALPTVREQLGDFERWFIEGLGAAHRFDVVQVFRDEPTPEVKGYDAVVMTGSLESVTRPTDWMKHSADYLVGAAAKGVPVLGVCFGHQLLGWAHGARVVRNPAGRETGTIQVELTFEGLADPLFQGLPSALKVQAIHEDVVETLPAGATLLATNSNSAVQAMAIGRCIRSVQFHPEFEADAMRAMIQAHRVQLAQEISARGMDGEVHLERLRAAVTATPEARQLLSNFLSRFT